MGVFGKVMGLGRNERYQKAVRLFDQGMFDEALCEFEGSGGDCASDPVTERLRRFYMGEAHASLGQTALRRGAWGRAEHHFREALAIHPQYADLHFSLGLALRRRSRLADALAEMNAALHINPRFAKAHYHRGLLLYALGEQEAGIESVGIAVELDAAYATETLGEALTAHAHDDRAGALHALEVVAATQVDDIQFHYRLGDEHFRKGEVEEAVGEYHKALALNPNYADVRNHLGVALSASGRYEEAAGEFRRALAVNPRYVDAWFGLATALRELGQAQEAGEAFRQVVALDPENLLARESLEGAVGATV